jgi:hypothetical protein
MIFEAKQPWLRHLFVIPALFQMFIPKKIKLQHKIRQLAASSFFCRIPTKIWAAMQPLLFCNVLAVSL